MSDETKAAKKAAWAEVKRTANQEGPEALLDALAAYFKADAANESHPAVVSSLESAAEHCSKASMAYYVSTK